MNCMGTAPRGRERARREARLGAAAARLTMLTILRVPDLRVLHDAGLEREQREVAADADVAAGWIDGADLADQDVARQDDLRRRSA